MDDINDKECVAVSLGDHKETALYFNKIYPIHSLFDVPKEIICNVDHWILRDFQVFRNLLPEEYTDVETRRKIALSVPKNERQVVFMDKYYNEIDLGEGADEFNEGMRNAVVSMMMNVTMEDVANVYVGFLNNLPDVRAGLIPVYSDYGAYYSGARLDSQKIPELSIITIKLSKLNIVDVSNASWEQIIDFKKDKESALKLMRFKNFILKNYEGKTTSFIKDDIAIKIEEYEKITKKHGFELKTSCIETILNAPSFLAATGLFLAGEGLGIPSTEVVAVASKVALDIGKIAIEIAKNRISLQQTKNGHPLAYIFSANENLNL